MGLTGIALTFGNLLLRSGRVKSQRTPHAPDLVQEVRDLLNQHRGQWKKIAPSSGVSYSWLSKFARGHIEDPGYGMLNRVWLHLRRGPRGGEDAATGASPCTTADIKTVKAR